MDRFPKLSTGAVAQYPAARTRRFSTQVIRFADGSEQRFPVWKAPITAWRIELNKLTTDELLAIRQFFRSQSASHGRFEFQDPFDEQVHQNCFIREDELAQIWQDHFSTACALWIEKEL
jgi:hypothetical protein